MAITRLVRRYTEEMSDCTLVREVVIDIDEYGVPVFRHERTVGVVHDADDPREREPGARMWWRVVGAFLVLGVVIVPPVLYYLAIR